MITENELHQLGYIRRMHMYDNTWDYKHKDFSERPYLLNLKDGHLTINHPLNSQKSSHSFDNIESFKRWHTTYRV